MRTNIDIDNELLDEARTATGLKTKKAVVDEALRRLVRGAQQLAAIKALKGLADWEGNIREMRKDRDLPGW